MPKTIETVPAGRDLYEADEHAWIAAQVEALTEGALHRLDRANLADYLTEMTIRDRRELRSGLTVLLIHLLKVRVQPERMTRSWVTTILDQQREIRSIIDGIPSLGRQAEPLAQVAYPDAVRQASRETGLPTARFPAALPWTVAEAVAFDLPEPVARGKRHL